MMLVVVGDRQVVTKVQKDKLARYRGTDGI